MRLVSGPGSSTTSHDLEWSTYTTRGVLMAWIRTIEPDEATGELRHEYGKAVGRAGRVFNIVKVMGSSPRHLRSSIDLYLGIMHGPSQLSRAQREMLAVVVSRANRCHY